MSLKQLQKLLPGEIFLQPATLAKYAGDKWFATHQPDAVASLPRSTQSVSQILAFTHKHKIPVTPRGAGHGYVGGCVPMHGGIALSTERMGKILEINAKDFVAVDPASSEYRRISKPVRTPRTLLSARSCQPREQFPRR